jgi:hypothetical protein
MPPKLAKLYPAPRSQGAPPPIFTKRNLAPPLAMAAAAAACWSTGERDAGIACAAVATVYATQLIAPAIRRRSLQMHGWAAEVGFASPFVLFFLPYVAWSLAVRPTFGWSWAGVALAILAGAAVHATDLRQLRLGFDRTILELMPALRGATALLRAYQTLGAAIGQELFYRGVLHALLTPTLGWAVVPVSTLLFVVEHAGNRWASTVFDLAYLLRIGALSAALGVIVYTTGSLWAALVGHVGFNLVPIAQLANRYLANADRETAAVAG